MHQPSILELLIAGASLASLARCQSSSTTDADGQETRSGSSFDQVSMTLHLQKGAVEISTSTAPGLTVTVTQTGSRPTVTAMDPETQSDEPTLEPEEMELDALIKVCYPGVPEQIDWTAPCPAMQAVQGQCTWGPEALEWLQKRIMSKTEYYIPDTWIPQPPKIQQACYCSSQWADVVVGCAACYEAHGGSKEFSSMSMLTSNATAMREWSAQYCDANLKPTADSFSDAMYKALGMSDDVPDNGTDSWDTESSSTLSDPLANATAVSLYYTASVSSAYVVALPTASSSANQSHSNAWYASISLQTSDGHIVPTAVAAKGTDGGSKGGDESGSDAAASSSGTATAAAGALQTAMVQSGLGIGALGFAVLAFAL